MKGKSSSPMDKKVEEVNRKGELLQCNECNYTCKRDKSLMNHTLTKYDHHHCKEWQEKLPNFMQLLKHMADHHLEEQNQTSEEDLMRDSMSMVREKRSTSKNGFFLMKCKDNRAN